MAFILKDRVKETTTTTGTGAVSLGGASDTFDTFQSYMTNGDTTYYAIVTTETGVDEWEVGLGTWNTGNTLTRTTILSGSNGASAVNFSAGEKEVFMTYPASKAVYTDASGDTEITGGSIDDTAIGATTASTGKFTTLETTSNADIGGYIDLEVLSDHATYQEGRIWYDSKHKTINFYSDDSDVVHEVGLEEHQRVYNNTGSTITKGSPLYFSGNYTAGDIDVPTVALANATDVNKYNAQGLAASDISNNSYGYCIVAGQLDGLDTSGLTAGKNFFVGLTDGAVQNSSPVYPNFPMCLGWVVNSDSTDGVLLVNQQNHSVNSFRVRTDAHVGDDLIVGGNLTVQGTTTTATSANVQLGASFQYLNAGDTIGTSGTDSSGVTGLDDATFTGHFTGTTSTTYYVKIDSVGTPDTFSVSTDNFATTISTGNAITGEAQEIHSADNISVQFGATTGHTLNDVWTGTAAPTAVDTGFFSNRNTGASGVGYTHMGIFYDVSEDKWTLLDEYDPEPEGTIDLSDSSVSYGTLKAGAFEGDLTGDVTGDVTGSASTAASLTTSRNIGGVAFNGTANIDLPGVNTQGNQDTTGNAATATALETSRTIQLTGDVTGSATFDGSANASITAVVQDNSHAHTIANVTGLQTALDDKADDTITITAGTGLTGGGDLSANRTISIDSTYTGFDTRYYTETEADSRFVNVTGDTMTGDLTISSTSPEIKLVDTNSFTDSNDRMIFRAGGDNLQWQWYDNSASSTTTLMTLNNVGQLTLGANTVFHDAYHPNADKWTTARTLTLSGDASGSVSWDGSANATLSVTVANDSHNHNHSDGGFTVNGNLIVNTDGTNTYGRISGYTNDNHFISIRGKVSTGTSTLTITPDHHTTFVEHANESDEGWYFVSKASGNYTEMARIDGVGQMYIANNKVWHAGNDGSGSGLDADTVDGLQASQFLRSDANTSTSGTLAASELKATSSTSDGGGIIRDWTGGNTYAMFGTANMTGDEYAVITDGISTYIGSGTSGTTHIRGPANDSNPEIRVTSTELVLDAAYITIPERIRHEGDTTTYIQFHANDQWRVVTGGNERLEVSNSAVLASVQIRSTGNITAYYSDERLKTKVSDIVNPLDKVMSLEGFYYVENDVAKSYGYDNKEKQVALSAQAVQAVMPEVVHPAPFDVDVDENGQEYSKSGENYLTIDYAKMVPLLVEAIKEQQTQIDELKEKLGM